MIFVHDRQHLEAVHFGHDDIEQPQSDFGVIGLQYGDGFDAVFRLYNFKFLAEHIGKN